MTSCHLVADANLTLLGDVDLGHLHDARRKLVADRDVEFLAAEFAVYLFRLAHIVGDQLTHHLVDALVVGPVGDIDRLVVDACEVDIVECASGRHEVVAEIILHSLRHAACEKRAHLVDHDVAELVLLLLVFFVEHRQLGVGAVLVPLLLHCAGEEVGADHHSLQRRACLERRIFHVAGLVAEDGAEKFLLGRRVALSLRSDLTDHDVARHNVGTHADDTAVVEVFRGFLAHVRDIRSEFLHASLGLTHFERELVDMD